MSDPIPKNQVRSINKITEHEHEEQADAKRVTLVDETGGFRNDTNPLPVYVCNKLIKIAHDEIEVMTKNMCGDPTLLHLRNEGTLVATMTIDYDMDYNFKKVTVQEV